MSNRELPMMPWYPDQFASATSTWNFAERAAYRALLDVQWAIGVLPKELWRLAHAIGMEIDAFTAVWPVVSGKFEEAGTGIRNFRLEQHRLAAMRRKEGQRSAAAQTNAKRLGNRDGERVGKRSLKTAKQATLSATLPLSPSPSPSEDPLTPAARGTNGADAPSRKGADRLKRDASREAWAVATIPIDHVRETSRLPPDLRLTWSYVQEHVDPIAWETIQQLGGCRVIAERDSRSEEDLKQRFREAYEQRLRQEQHA